MGSNKKSLCINKISESIEASAQNLSQDIEEKQFQARDVIKITGSLKETVKGSESN